jgi:hypothetical protein
MMTFACEIVLEWVWVRERSTRCAIERTLGVGEVKAAAGTMLGANSRISSGRCHLQSDEILSRALECGRARDLRTAFSGSDPPWAVVKVLAGAVRQAFFEVRVTHEAQPY